MTRALVGSPAIGVVTNPHSRKNKRRPGRAAALHAILKDQGIVRETKDLRELEDVVREFRELGVRYWVADGGDGALFWMLNKAAEILGESSQDIPGLIPVAVPANGGTIDFVARRAGIRGRADGLVRALVEQSQRESRGEPVLPTLELPTMQLSGRRRLSPQGTSVEFEYVGFSSAVAGCATRFFEMLYSYPDRSVAVIAKIMVKLSGSSLADLTPLRRLFPQSWLEPSRQLMRPIALRVKVDGREMPFRDVTTFNVSSLDVNFGNLVRFFPYATDESLHVMVGEPTAGEVTSNVPRMILGLPMKCAGLFEEGGKVVEVEPAGDELLAPVVDGEILPGIEFLRIERGPKIRFAVIDGR